MHCGYALTSGGRGLPAPGNPRTAGGARRLSADDWRELHELVARLVELVGDGDAAALADVVTPDAQRTLAGRRNQPPRRERR